MTKNIFCSNYLELQEDDKIDDMNINIFDTQDLIGESREQQNYISYNFYNNDFDYDIDSINQEYYPLENDLKNSKTNEENLVSNKEDIFPTEAQKNVLLGKKTLLNEENKVIFKKNRNNLYNNIFKTLNDKNDKSSSINDNNNNNNLTNETSSSNNNNNNNNKIAYSNMRCDSLLIKFKSFLGKSFISFINDKLKKSTKRRIKLFSFNYKKFTLNVSYSENQKWFNEKMKDLLVLGSEPNQLKNEKALKSIYRRKEEEFSEIKYLLESNYKEIIQRFYRSKFFENFKKQQKIIQLDDNFKKVMNNSILDQDGFINFICSRKGNKGKQEDDDIDSV